MQITYSQYKVGEWMAQAKINGSVISTFSMDKIEAMNELFAKINWFLYGIK